MILSCILLRKMDNVVVSGFGAVLGLGRSGEIWALAEDARTERDTMLTGTTTRAKDRNINARTMRQVPIELRIVQKRFFGKHCIRLPPAWQRVHARFQLARRVLPLCNQQITRWRGL